METAPSETTPFMSQSSTLPSNFSNTPSFNYASFFRRSIASLIDGLIIAIIVMAINYLFSLVIVGSVSDTNLKTVVNILILTNFFSFLIVSFYSVYFIGSSGQTPGKKLLKIKVVRLDTTSASPGYLKAILRETIGKMLSSLFYLGYLWMLWDSKKQCWHDKIAGTVVIKI